MNIVIIENSHSICGELNDILKNNSEITSYATFGSLLDSIPIIQLERPDVIFLDIDISGKDSFDLLHKLDFSPRFLFTSSFIEHAVRAFEFDVVDYLLKPCSSERLQRAIERLLHKPIKAVAAEKLTMDHHLLLNNGDENYWVSLRDIHYFESCANHSLVVWSKNKALIHRALVSIEMRLPENQFIRVNRKQIVNINYVNKVDSWVNGGFRLQMGPATNIEVSRRQAGRFKERFSL